MGRIERIQGGLRSRGYLVHADAPGVTQFVTIRLADGLPHPVSQRLRGIRDRAERARESERLLDHSLGSCVLARPDCAEVVECSLRHRQGREFDLLAWVVMPNHVHILVKLEQQTRLGPVLRRWKSWMGREINRLTERRGALWQRDYFDRQAVDEVETERFARYIERNPVAAGLCGQPEDWRYSSAWFRVLGSPVGSVI